MADDFPDLHHKLCLHHFSTKSDETDQIIKSAQQTYEEEMDNLVQAANNIITKHINENPQLKELHEINKTYKAFKNQIEDERIAAWKEFNSFQEATKVREREIQEEAQKQVKKHQQEVDLLKEKLWHVQKLAEKVVGSEIKFDETEHKAKEMEYEKMKRDLAEKERENGILNMRLLELERMYRELEETHLMSDKTNWSHDEWEAEMLRKKVVEQEKLILALRKAIGQENGLLDGDEVASIEFGVNSNRDLNNFSGQVKDLQKELLVSERIVKEKDDEIEKLRDRLKENSSEDKLQKKIEEYESRLREAGREHRKLIETLHNEYTENMADMEDQINREKLRMETMLQGMKATLDSRNDYITGLEEKLKSMEGMKEKMEESQVREQNLNLEIEKLNKQVKDLKAQLEAERNKAEEEKKKMLERLEAEKEESVRALKNELKVLKGMTETDKDKKLRELEKEVEALSKFPEKRVEERSRELAEEYQRKVNDLSQKHNNSLREFMEKHEEKANQMKRNYENELEQMRKELKQEKDTVLRMKEEDKNSEISKLKKEYEAKMQKISKSYDQQLDEKLHEYEAKLKTKDLEVADSRKEIEKIKEQLKQEMKKREEKEASCKELEKTVKEQKNAIAVIQGELQDKQLESEGGAVYKAELAKLKEGNYFNKDKEDIIKEHLKYAESIEKKFRELKRQSEERIQMLMERYNELVEAFEKRPSRTEDLALIRQLQEENGKEEEVKKMPEKSRSNHSESLRKDEFKSFGSQGGLAPGVTTSADKTRKNTKNISPAHVVNSSLPPIAISQFSIHLRSPPSNGLLTTKKFFGK